MLKTKRKLKILDFDIESRPLSYLGSDFTTSEVTAIASCWTDDVGSMEVYLLGVHTSEAMLNSFRARYEEADMVTGHYIRNFDLPSIQGALMDFGLPTLGPKLTSCTKNDLLKRKGISASQENLSQMLDLSADKVHMSQIDWRLANRLTEEGIQRTKKRVAGDVYQHMLMRAKLLQLGLLGPAKDVESVVDALLAATGLFFLMSLILVGLIIYESKKIAEHNALMSIFMEANAEIFGVINANAAVQREAGKRIEKLEVVTAYYATVLDAHAHALSVYGPALRFSDSKLSDNVKDLENFGD